VHGWFVSEAEAAAESDGTVFVVLSCRLTACNAG
jgi:hypothetical protein